MENMIDEVQSLLYCMTYHMHINLICLRIQIYFKKVTAKQI